mgnify:CR=1 FL=1
MRAQAEPGRGTREIASGRLPRGNTKAPLAIPVGCRVECSAVPDEIEAKFKVDDFRTVRRSLRAAGAVFVVAVLETDTYYDTPSQAMLDRDCGLRLRRTRRLRSGEPGYDARPALTAKGPRRKGENVKSRPEFEARPDDPEALAYFLAAAGLVPSFTVQKRRSIYRLGRTAVMLDELPVIGRFVEVEAGSEASVRRAARRLGLDSEPITEHYIGLLLRNPEIGSKRPVQVVFGGAV